MKKVSYTAIVEYIILFATAIILGLFLFIVPPKQIRLNLLRISVAGLGFLSFLLVCNKTSLKYNQTYSFAKRYIIVTLSIVVCFIFYTSYLYNYSIYATLTLSIQYFWLLFAFAIIYVLNNEKNKNSFWRKIIFITLVFICVRFIAWLASNYLNSNLFINFVNEYPDWKRNGLQRLIGGQTFQIIFIVILSDALTKKRYKKSLIINKVHIHMEYFILFLIFLYSIFVTRARSGVAILFITFVWTIVLTRKKSNTRIMFMLLIFSSISILFICGIFDPIIESFTQTGKYWLSTEARLDGLKHFWDLFKSIGHYFALGYVSDGYTTEHLFYRTSWLRYYLGDLGIISAFFRFGIFIIPIYGYLFKEAIFVSKKAIKRKSPYSALIVATSTYMILSCIISNIYDAQMAFAVPFYVAIISYVDGKNKELL